MRLRSLSIGMRGEDVRAVQATLNLQPGLSSPPLDADGIFGPKTDARVRAYQDREGLSADGIVGPKTRLALFPYGVANVTVVGARLLDPSYSPSRFAPRYPSFGVGRLTPPTLGFPGVALPPAFSGPTTLTVDWSKILTDFRASPPPYIPTRIPIARPLLAAPAPLELSIPIPPAPGSAASNILGFDYDHFELVPGAQSTFPLGGWRQDAFTLTMQTIYQRGPDDGPNQTITAGVQMGAPVVAPFPNGGPWTFNPFIQYTDVDRFGALGMFHWWQPYGQIGAQIQGPGDAHPTIAGGVFPFNLGLDLGTNLTLQAAGGFVFGLDLATGQATAGPQLTFGLAVKFGKSK
jgi:peptidoglycan hydrolase-like protein with peptidoglycan-binding domain